MKKDYDQIINEDYVKTVSIFYDENSDGIKLVDNHGISLNIEQIEQLVKGLNNYNNTHDKSLMKTKQDREMQKALMDISHFRKYKPKKGYVFVYKELTTNKYRFVATQNFDSRFSSLEKEFPNGIELIVKHQTNDVNLLKSILETKFENRRLANNWYGLDETSIAYIKDKGYSEIFNKKEQEKQNEILESIICKTCHNRVTNLEADYYFKCIICQRTYCSHECAIETPHTC